MKKKKKKITKTNKERYKNDIVNRQHYTRQTFYRHRHDDEKKKKAATSYNRGQIYDLCNCVIQTLNGIINNEKMANITAETSKVILCTKYSIVKLFPIITIGACQAVDLKQTKVSNSGRTTKDQNQHQKIHRLSDNGNNKSICACESCNMTVQFI